MSEIRGGMNIHALNNLLTWNMPYIIARVLKLVVTIYFMTIISIKLTFIICLIYVLFRFGVMKRLEKFEKHTQKMDRKNRILCE